MHLTPIHLRFLQGLLADRSDRTPSASAELFSRECNIGTRIGRKFVYAAQDVERARSLLVTLHLPLVAQVGPTDRAGAVDRPGISEKSGTVNPHNNKVAFRMFAGRTPVAQPGYQVATVEEFGCLALDLVIVVENFETLRQLDRYEWVMERLKSAGNTLALYRGDTIYRLNDASLSLATMKCPVWGFHDFDPAGLAMSMSLQNLEEHLVPTLAVLRAAVETKKRSDLYFNQVDQYAKTLEACRHPQIANLWVLMKGMRKGLPQEWMRDL